MATPFRHGPWKNDTLTEWDQRHNSLLDETPFAKVVIRVRWGIRQGGFLTLTRNERIFGSLLLFSSFSKRSDNQEVRAMLPDM